MPVRRVNVGATPERRYATWDEHRKAIRAEALKRRRLTERRPRMDDERLLKARRTGRRTQRKAT